ncbi:MAG: tetratricopeptide repeat protein [Acidimicrobiales bacterium]
MSDTMRGLADVESLAEQRDFLLASLRDLDLEEQAGDLSAEDALALREDYTARAAAVLRALERRTPSAPYGPGLANGSSAQPATGTRTPQAGPSAQPALAASTAAAPGLSGQSGQRQGQGPSPRLARRHRSRLLAVLGVGGVLAFAGAAGLAVARTSGERISGQQVSGTLPGQTTAGRDLARAQRLFSQGRLLDAIKAFDSVLRSDPSNAAALTSRGWLLRLVGVQAGRPELVDRGLASLDQAIAADPSYPDAHLFRGILLFRDRHDPKAAIPELQRWLASNPPPDRVRDVERVLKEAEAQAQAGGAPASTGPSGAAGSTAPGSSGSNPPTAP